MIKLTVDEFVRAVMFNGNELEFDEYNSCHDHGDICDDPRPCDDPDFSAYHTGCDDCPERKRCCCYTCKWCYAWEVYAHIAPDGDVLLWDKSADDELIISARFLLSMQDSEKLMNGELDDVEADVIESELYPQYLAVLEDLDDDD